jgi:hypothetical protein
MKRSVMFVSVVLASLAFAGTSLARENHGHRGQDVASATQPDQVIQWNQELLQLLPAGQPAGIHPTRTLAITQLAVLDAVRASEHDRGAGPVSADAATASAARTALEALLLPSQDAAIESFYASSLAAIGSGPAVDRGIQVGADTANQVLASRANDAANVTPTPFTPFSGPGEYQLTPPANAPAGFTQTAHVTPFVLDSADQFRPGPPPALTSARYAADFAQVKSLGRATSTTRTADQTAIGRFWGVNPIWIAWNQIADQAAVAFNHSLAQNARLLAVENITLADSAIALYDAKYTYHRWRPITAITATNQGNNTTISDPTWVPLTNTANDPSYPGAHANFSSAAATVLEHFFHTDSFAFSLTAGSPATTRSFQSFSGAAAEASVSRILAGQHFQFDQDAGLALGQQVAQFDLHHFNALVHQGAHR